MCWINLTFKTQNRFSFISLCISFHVSCGACVSWNVARLIGAVAWAALGLPLCIVDAASPDDMVPHDFHPFSGCFLSNSSGRFWSLFGIMGLFAGRLSERWWKIRTNSWRFSCFGAPNSFFEAIGAAILFGFAREFFNKVFKRQCFCFCLRPWVLHLWTAHPFLRPLWSWTLLWEFLFLARLLQGLSCALGLFCAPYSDICGIRVWLLGSSQSMSPQTIWDLGPFSKCCESKFCVLGRFETKKGTLWTWHCCNEPSGSSETSSPCVGFKVFCCSPAACPPPPPSSRRRLSDHHPNRIIPHTRTHRSSSQRTTWHHLIKLHDISHQRMTSHHMADQTTWHLTPAHDITSYSRSNCMTSHTSAWHQPREGVRRAGSPLRGTPCRRWPAASVWVAGAIFRTVFPLRKRLGGLTGKGSHISSKAALAAGFAGELAGSRSLRKGGATAFLASARDLERLKSYGGWSSDAVHAYLLWDHITQQGFFRGMLDSKLIALPSQKDPAARDHPAVALDQSPRQRTKGSRSFSWAPERRPSVVPSRFHGGCWRCRAQQGGRCKHFRFGKSTSRPLRIHGNPGRFARKCVSSLPKKVQDASSSQAFTSRTSCQKGERRWVQDARHGLGNFDRSTDGNPVPEEEFPDFDELDWAEPKREETADTYSTEQVASPSGGGARVHRQRAWSHRRDYWLGQSQGQAGKARMSKSIDVFVFWIWQWR